MGQITSGAWWAAAGVRALRTGAQALATLIGTGQVGVTDLDWPQMLSVAATMMVLSLLTSLAGLPEVEGGGADAVA
ncbi:holin [Olsenella uli]|uniref:holin n=1 Tax=Olsenella uli TaxID=133926 RepID=UPI0028E379BC|nr:holin [Olsenella uli]